MQSKLSAALAAAGCVLAVSPVCERYGDIERRAEKAVRYDEISGRRRRSVGWILRTATGDGADGRVLDRIKIIKQHGSRNRAGSSPRINGDRDGICQTLSAMLALLGERRTPSTNSM
jgi:hypothetical protein